MMQNVSIEDRVAIEDLFVTYACALDEGDADTVVECFAEDASHDIGNRARNCAMSSPTSGCRSTATGRGHDAI